MNPTTINPDFQQLAQPQRTMEVEITISPHRGSFFWSFVILRRGKESVLRWGLLNRRDCPTAERCWMYAASMAFEWRDHNTPNSRLIIRESSREEKGRAA